MSISPRPLSHLQHQSICWTTKIYKQRERAAEGEEGVLPATRIKIQFHLVACEEGVGVCLPRTSYVCLGEYVWGAMPGWGN